MTQYIPLETSTGDTPVYLLNTQAPLPDLLAFAHRRINAARKLVQTLSCTTLKNTDDSDLLHVSEALYVLLEDGCEVMAVIGRRVMELEQAVTET